MFISKIPLWRVAYICIYVASKINIIFVLFYNKIRTLMITSEILLINKMLLSFITSNEKIMSLSCSLRLRSSLQLLNNYSYNVVKKYEPSYICCGLFLETNNRRHVSDILMFQSAKCIYYMVDKSSQIKITASLSRLKILQ